MADLADADRLALAFQQEGYTATSYRLDQLFRDYLRAHPRAAAAYAALKRALAERLGDDLAAYTELKAPPVT